MRLIFILLVYFPLICQAQVQDSFNDGDFKNSPPWSGSDELFMVNTHNELQLNDADAGAAFLSTPSQSIEEASWQVKVKMNFNPSSANYARIYLASDKKQPVDAHNAVFIEFGSSDDNICLYIIENGNKEKLIEGATDRLNHAEVDLIVKVTRSGNRWTLLSNMGNGWITEGEAEAQYNYAAAYFSIHCQYTKTRADKFFFDDIQVQGLPYRDKSPPVITDFELNNGSQMSLTFNKALDESSISSTCFTLQNSQRHPANMVYNNDTHMLNLHFDPIIDDTDHDQLIVSGIRDTHGNSMSEQTFSYSYKRIKVNQVRLVNRDSIQLSFSKSLTIETFANMNMQLDKIVTRPVSIGTDDNHTFIIQLPEKLENGRQYELTISGLTDAINDPVPDISITLMHYDALRFDVVFNEWMADPVPSMGLPEVEFIELFNNSPYNINLSDWTLQINDNTVSLPDSVIEAGGLICLVSSKHIDDWNKVVATAFIKSMPGLTNSGFEMFLYNADKHIVDAFNYQTQLIEGEGFKKDGGWSAERIDPANKSGSPGNFHWSMNLNGGTPGQHNSVHNDLPDRTPPVITGLKLHDKKELLVRFSETMDFNTYSVELAPELNITQQHFDQLFLNQLELEFENELPANAIYQLMSVNIKDMSGNTLVLDAPIIFGVPDTVTKDDLLINEVLFNPHPGGADFVEIYNTSNKLINLADLYFAEIKDDQIEKLHQVSEEVLLLQPHSYIAITTDKEKILQNYNCPQQDALVETSTLPSYPDDEGHVVLANKKGIVLDAFIYHQNMHFDLLKDKEGVSLERLSWDLTTQASDNWLSAASTAGYATPGYLNSQQLRNSKETSSLVSIHPEVFTPNNNGADDQLQILMNSDEPNAIVTIRVYDPKGNEVRYLANNLSLANSNIFTWDGMRDDGTKLQPGIYLIYVQCTYGSGQVHEEKIPCVIGTGSN
ncbi:lamin tail domain-containing protein [Carboxylicivirga sp. RSCT41]|uniref:lamin tail domain-containing protein n=1 Tax=Carboxylicivirga agarovorans TaxID=3417570 RepID=UPI003D33843C